MKSQNKGPQLVISCNQKNCQYRNSVASNCLQLGIYFGYGNLQTTQGICKTIGCSPQPDDRALLLKISTKLTKHQEFKSMPI